MPLAVAGLALSEKLTLVLMLETYLNLGDLGFRVKCSSF